MKARKSFAVLAAFAGHIVMGVVMFCIVASAAVALHVVADWLVAIGIDGLVHIGLVVLEDLLFACDFVALAVWAIMSTVKAVKDLIKED